MPQGIAACEVCGLPRATASDVDRHGDECDNGNNPWTHWCKELCWCVDVHHAVMAGEPSQGPGFCNVCKPKQPVESSDA